MHGAEAAVAKADMMRAPVRLSGGYGHVQARGILGLLWGIVVMCVVWWRWAKCFLMNVCIYAYIRSIYIYIYT